MKVKTDMPLIDNREKITRKIAAFSDQISEGWRLVWGPHIHHGYYENNQAISPLAAQEILIHKLAAIAEITPHARILDVGCGMGASSLYMAKKYQATVTGITLSQKQVALATQAAREKNIKNVNFKMNTLSQCKALKITRLTLSGHWKAANNSLIKISLLSKHFGY